MRQVVVACLAALGAYLAAGAAFAAVFHAFGIRRLDPAAEGTGWGFRLLVTPGVVALWPLLALAWRRAAAGVPARDATERPVSPRRLRALHGLCVRALAVAVPLVAGAALYARPGLPPALALALPRSGGAPALPRLAASDERPFGALPVRLRLRADDAGTFQVELLVARELEVPAAGMFWGMAASPPDHPRDAASPDGLPAGAVYLGPLWGPGTLRYRLPPAASAAPGVLYLATIDRAHEVVARADLAAVLAGGPAPGR